MKFSRIIRVTALLLLPPVTCSTMGLAEKKPMNPAAVKARLQARGAGRQVRIALKDSEVSGEIVTIGDESCVIHSKQQAQPVTVAYANVIAVHNGNSKIGKRVGIGVLVGVAALVIAAVVVIVSVAGSNTP